MTQDWIPRVEPTDSVSLAVACAACGVETLMPASEISEGTVVVCACGERTILGESIAQACRYVLDRQAGLAS